MNAPQTTHEWLQARVGHATASRAPDILAKIKSGEAAARRRYRIQLATERLTGTPAGSTYVSAPMAWGMQTEGEARMAYELERGAFVEEVGFLTHPAVPWVGASPDGVVGDDGLVEIKCPESTTHVEWMSAGVVPADHVAQIQFQLWVTGRQWCDFVSYDPRFPGPLQLFIVRVERDEEYIATLAKETALFLAEVETTCKSLTERIHRGTKV